ncbi:MAG: efflux RND transporter periplasmic adaptor subunit [Micavibrio sp.]|nr:efflux RND transporter periplasmic adaptor subunit [Micavibrio sp.]
MKIKYLGIVILALCILSPHVQAQAPGAEQNATPVIVSVVEEKPFADEVEALGTLYANESVNLTSTVTELVTKINFEDNQKVTQGDILVEMDAAEELAELEEQKSFLNEAQRQVNRLAPLIKQGAASKSVLDESKREVLAAQARINAIQSRIDQRVIQAPFDGVLGLRQISVGALAQPGTKITTIDDTNVMKLDFSVPEVFLSTLTSGVEIKATTEAYPDEVFTGKISSVDSRIDPVTRSLRARALIDNAQGRLKPGLLMQVELQKNPRQTLVVPEEALIPEGSNTFILVVSTTGDKTTAERRKVELGQRQFGEVEILSGVKIGDKVVTHGTLRVRPGAPLEITATEKSNEPLNQLLNQNTAPDENSK